jgi:hypothetical protein
MNESLHGSQPDLERLRTVLLRRGESDRVPLYDFLPIRFGIATEVLNLLERGAGEGSLRIRTAHPSTGRGWAAEHEGFITSWADMETYPWPQPADVSYAVPEATGRMLPPDMRLITHASGLLMHVRICMGLERFWTTLEQMPP